VTRFDCDQARRCLDELLDGTLTGDDREALQVHLDVCPACRDLHEGWSVIGSVMKDTALPPLDAEVEARILAGGAAAATATRAMRRDWRPLGWAMAIAAAILATAWLVPRLLVPPEIPVSDAGPAQATPPRIEPIQAQPTIQGPVLAPVVEPVAEVLTDPDPADPIDVASAVRADALEADGAAEDALDDEALQAVTPVIAALDAGRLDEARELALVVAVEQPDSPRTIDVFARLAQEHRRARRYADACEIYGQLIDTWPHSAAATNSLVALGQVRQGAMGQPAESLVHFDDYLAASPSGVLAEEARVGRVRALAELDRHDELLASATEYLALHPRGTAAPEVYALRGDALRRAGMLGVAAEDYRAVLDRWPESPFAAQARTGLEACGGTP